MSVRASVGTLFGMILIIASAHAEVNIANSWVRGVVPGQTATGMFMTITSTEPTHLIAASSPVAQSVQIHRMVMNGDSMTMRPVSSVAIPRNGSVEFGPGGYHLMFVGLKSPLVKGEHVPVTLTFRGNDGKKTDKEVQAEVRDLTESAMDPVAQ